MSARSCVFSLLRELLQRIVQKTLQNLGVFVKVERNKNTNANIFRNFEFVKDLEFDDKLISAFPYWCDS